VSYRFPVSSLPGVVWREPENRPHPIPLSCSARESITEAESLEIKPLAGLSTTETGTLPEHTFSAIAIAPAGLKGHCSLLIERAAVLAIQHVEAEPLDVAAAFLQSLATSRCRLAGFGMGAQQMLNRPWITGPKGEGAVTRPHQLLSRDRQLLSRNQWPAAGAVGTTATRARRGLGRGGLSAEAQGRDGGWGHGWRYGAPFSCAADSGLEPRGKGTVWLDELHARGPEMAATGNSRWRAVGDKQRAVAGDWGGLRSAGGAD